MVAQFMHIIDDCNRKARKNFPGYKEEDNILRNLIRGQYIANHRIVVNEGKPTNTGISAN